MLNHNELVLDICEGRCTPGQAVDRMRDVVRVARRTRDLRFFNLASWFEQIVAAACREADPPWSPVGRRVQELRTNGRVPIEMFVPTRLGKVEIEAPYVLSPNWRY